LSGSASRPSTISKVVLPTLLFLLANNCSVPTEKQKVVETGSVVALEYTLSDENGKVIDSNKDKPPLTYTQGKGQIIPGLENELLGMEIGGQKNVVVQPEDGYGSINPKAFQEVPKEKLPRESLTVGTTLIAKNSQGQSLPVRVYEIREKTVILDFNHPLAGKTLSFDVKILSIKSPEIK
jgi:FKBP-type peptidyl-prolyl cis-trans isomerase SlyD